MVQPEPCNGTAKYQEKCQCSSNAKSKTQISQFKCFHDANLQAITEQTGKYL